MAAAVAKCMQTVGSFSSAEEGKILFDDYLLSLFIPFLPSMITI